MSSALLEVRGVSKSFPGVQALGSVDFSVRAGEVVALIGENGAGKSTLMKILAGLHQPDSGQILLDEVPISFTSPAAALRQGIALIHQELNLCENLTVTGALFLGAELVSGPFLREKEMADEARAVLLRLGLDLAVNRLVESLSPGQKQLLEIGRALRAKARVLIMDEPTSSLTQVETDRLLAVTGELKAEGVAIVYISHRLAEVRQIADRVVALRDGRNSGECSGADADHDRLVAMMIGRELTVAPRTPHPPGEVALAVTGLRTMAFPDQALDFEVRCGEVVGVAGLLGSGRTELLRAMFGADGAAGGSIRVGDVKLQGHQPAAAVRAGLALVPEDRKSQGLIQAMSVAANLSLPTLSRRGYLVDRVYEETLCRDSIEMLGIVTSGGAQLAATLSGGNQQKIVLGKWLAARPTVLLLDEPTRGVDVSARAEIHSRLHELAGEGLAVLFVSSELEEVLTLADRVLVMHRGRLMGEVPHAELSEQAIMRLAVAMPEASTS